MFRCCHRLEIIFKKGLRTVIKLRNVNVIFNQGKSTIHAVKDVDLTVEKKDVYGIVGYSGAGKSTLVRVINLLQSPSTGEVLVRDTNLMKLNPSKLRKERKKIGMIFQHFNLLNERTIFDNVAFSLKYQGLNKSEIKNRVLKLLDLVGLKEKASAYPKQLSGGQKQRVAIARALVNDPEILLCDEATSALDPRTTMQILSLLKKLNKELGLTIVIITHEMQVVKEICNKVAVMENGSIIEEGSSLQIFTSPQENLTKDFIRTATHIDQALETINEHGKFSVLNSNEWLAELSYVGDETNQPIIPTLYSEFGITTNILYGNVEFVQETPFGSMIVILSGERDNLQEALLYLKVRGIRANLLKGVGV